MTGRTICGPCARGLDAATLGLATGDTVGGQLGNAVGTDGIRGLLRRALGKRD